MTAEKSITAALKEVRRNLALVFLFDTFINAILVFLLAALLLLVFDLHLVYPLAVSAAYFLYAVIRRLSINKVRMVEKRYKNVNEKLRTAEEFRDPDNRVVMELHSEVIRDLKKVEQSAFISDKKIYLKSIGIIALSFLVFFASPFTIGLINFNLNFVNQQIEQFSGGVFEGGSGESVIRFSTEQESTEELRKVSQEIYGTAAVAKLGNEEITIKIRPSGTELSIREIQELDLPDFSESYPKEIAASSAESYEESIRKEDLELVKGYFNNLASS